MICSTSAAVSDRPTHPEAFSRTLRWASSVSPTISPVRLSTDDAAPMPTPVAGRGLHPLHLFGGRLEIPYRSDRVRQHFPVIVPPSAKVPGIGTRAFIMSKKVAKNVLTGIQLVFRGFPVDAGPAGEPGRPSPDERRREFRDRVVAVLQEQVADLLLLDHRAGRASRGWHAAERSVTHLRSELPELR